MKKLLFGSMALAALAMFVLSTQTSCKKETVTETITKRDTIFQCPPVKTPEEFLTSKTWKADEIRVQQSNNVFVYYNRGGATNTVNYDSDSLKFNPNNTGIYYSLGTLTTTTWNFTNPQKTKMNIKINYSTPLTLSVENVLLTENSFQFSQYYVYIGISYVGYGRRIPN